MAYTEQQRALDRVKKEHGPTGYTIHHLHYKLVGFGEGAGKVFALGNTWDEAIQRLARKAKKAA